MYAALTPGGSLLWVIQENLEVLPGTPSTIPTIAHTCEAYQITLHINMNEMNKMSIKFYSSSVLKEIYRKS